MKRVPYILTLAVVRSSICDLPLKLFVLTSKIILLIDIAVLFADDFKPWEYKLTAQNEVFQETTILVRLSITAVIVDPS